MEYLGSFVLSPPEINQLIFYYLDLTDLRSLNSVNLGMKCIVGNSATMIKGNITDITEFHNFPRVRKIKGNIILSSISQLKTILELELNSFTGIFDKNGMVWPVGISRKENHSRGNLLAEMFMKYKDIKRVHLKFGSPGKYYTLFLLDRGYLYVFPALEHHFVNFPVDGVILSVPDWRYRGEEKQRRLLLAEQPIESLQLRDLQIGGESPWYKDLPTRCLWVNANKHTCGTIRYITWNKYRYLRNIVDGRVDGRDMVFDCYCEGFISINLSNAETYPKVEICDVPVLPWQVPEFVTVFPNARRVLVLIPGEETKNKLLNPNCCGYVEQKDEIIRRLESASMLMKSLVPTTLVPAEWMPDLPVKTKIYQRNGLTFFPIIS